MLFGGRARLIGYALQPGARLTAGRASNLDLTLVWQAERPLDVAYTVFTQLVNADGKLVAQHDGPPEDGQSPTTSWEPGEQVPDAHRIAIPRDLPPGEYTLIAGLYDPRDGTRLPIGPEQTYAEIAKVTLAR